MAEPAVNSASTEQPKTYKLVRGSLACTNSQMNKVKKMLSDSKPKLPEIKGLLESVRLSHNFSGIMYSIRTNRNIIIKGLSFWGPFKKEKENYRVKVIFTQYTTNLPSDNTKDEVVLDRFERNVEGERLQSFSVQCPQDIKAEKGKWIRIRFQLDGAETCVSSSVANFYSMKDCDMEFEFFDSSHQIPEIHFQIA